MDLKTIAVAATIIAVPVIVIDLTIRAKQSALDLKHSVIKFRNNA